MRPEGEDPQAPKGGHDDWIMAWAMLWQLKRFVPTGGVKIKSYAYKD